MDLLSLRVPVCARVFYHTVPHIPAIQADGNLKVPLSRRSIVFGLVSAMFGLASVAGPLIGGSENFSPIIYRGGGVFTSSASTHCHYRNIYCLYNSLSLPIGAISIFVIAFVLKNPSEIRKST